MSSKAENISSPNILFVALKTVIKAVVITVAALLILTLFVTYGDMSDAAVSGCITAATVISVFASGFFVSRSRPRSGWLSGLIAAAVYVLFILIIGFFVFDGISVGADTLKMLLVSAVSGVAGGIFGVNFKKKRK